MSDLILTLNAGSSSIKFAMFEASDRELWLVAVAWVLGFWLASGIGNTLEAQPDDDGDDSGDWDEDDE